MPYSPLLVKPFREELIQTGIQELTTAQAVDDIMKQNKGTLIVFVNSVCGCAAGTARPAINQVMQGKNKPDVAVSVFAGQDLEATARFRSYIADIPPSSPSIAFFKDGELAYFIPKHRIESRDANALAQDIQNALEEIVSA